MNKRRVVFSLMIGIFAIVTAGPALAYVGPGAGISLLSALWALIAVIGSAILYVILWPLRRWRKRRKQKKYADHEAGGKEARSRDDHDPAANEDAGSGTKKKEHYS